MAKEPKGKGGEKSTKIGRDAKSGQFIPVKEAERRPKTTVVETIKKPGTAGKTQHQKPPKKK